MSRNTSRARHLREQLKLKHLNVESGHFALLGKSDLQVTLDGVTLPASNVIYLMLDDDEPINYLQWLASDDIQVLIEGGPADYYLFFEDGNVQKKTMGHDLTAGHQLIVHAPAATTKAIVLHEEADYALMGSIVTPAWSPSRVRIGVDQAFIQRHSGLADWASEEFLEFLAGPAFGEITGGDSDECRFELTSNGEILYQGMQLSLAQAIDELHRLAQQPSFKNVQLMVEPEADKSLVEAISEAAKSRKLHVAKNSDSENS